jgi:CDP-glucose 4,6-dehydratase
MSTRGWPAQALRGGPSSSLTKMPPGMDSTWNSLSGRSVLVTGHTGFKGSWLTLWLHTLGARVSGYSLDPGTAPNNFEASQIAPLLVDDLRGDIRDAPGVHGALERCVPEVIFHLAAQPIVRQSLVAPRETFDINVVGTATLLEAVRSAARPCAVIVVTSDKCYRNDGQVWGFRESDPLGGHDPYSASKAGTEMVVEAFRSSYFPAERIAEHGVHLASVRAGNVIGGGDWSVDRILPDAVRALSTGQELVVRNPASTRPWQHVLEPLSGYLTLAARMIVAQGAHLSEAWNFGPLTTQEATVAELADAVVKRWGSGSWVQAGETPANVEAKTLRISIDKAVSLLGWQPQWDFGETVGRTVDWYRSFYDSGSSSMREPSLADISAYGPS